MVQKQDLIVFQDYSIIPKNGKKNCLFLTYSLGTSPSWLTHAFIEVALFDEAASLNEKKSFNNITKLDNSNEETGITVASFIHNKDYLEKNVSNKLKLKKLHEDHLFKIVDLTTMLQTESLNNIFEKITKDNKNKTLVLEQPEILLATTPNQSANNLNLNLIDPLFQHFDNIIVVSNLDFYSSMPNNHQELQFNQFTQSIFYKSVVNLNIKPLSTGRANDVTGTLSIVKGGDSNEKNGFGVIENEYLFHTQRETTKLFYR